MIFFLSQGSSMVFLCQKYLASVFLRNVSALEAFHLRNSGANDQGFRNDFRRQ